MPVDATEPTGLAAHLPAGTHLGSQVWRYDRGPLACALLLALVGAAANLMVPWLVQRTIGAFTEHRPLGALVTVMAVSAVGGAIASSCSGYLLARVGERLILRLRCQVMTHILRLPISVVRRHGTGNLVARVTADATRLRSVIDVGVVQLPLAILTVCATIVAMALLDGTLVLLTLASFTVAATGIGLILKHVRRNAIAQQNATGALAHRFTAHLAALVTIKAYRAEARIGERLGDDAAQVTRTSMAGARLLSLITPVMGLGQQTAMVVVILGGGARLVDGTLSTGSFAAFLLYLLQLVGPVTLIATGVGRLQSGIAARVRFDELLAIPTEFDHGLPNALAKAETDAPAVSFRLVSLHHTDAAVPALKDVSFTLPRTGLTALVGPSGAGKSTALALVEGFLDPDGGEVHVLGRNVRDWPLADLRRHIAYVDQQFTLVEDTVRENLLLGHDDPVATSRLRGALESVGLLSDIDALPQGLETVLGRQHDLSGGQRQRLATARALLTDAPLVLLDEPTSQQDGLNEQRFRAILDDLSATRSVLVVAHRLSTIRHADQVLLLDEGVLDGPDTHEGLLAHSLRYQELVRGQAGGWSPGGGS